MYGIKTARNVTAAHWAEWTRREMRVDRQIAIACLVLGLLVLALSVGGFIVNNNEVASANLLGHQRPSAPLGALGTMIMAAALLLLAAIARLRIAVLEGLLAQMDLEAAGDEAHQVPL